MTAPWLSVIGIGEDGAAGLAPAARALIAAAETVVGGARHLSLAADAIPPAAERISWQGLAATLEAILSRGGRPVAVLASGDPMQFGVGATLARHVPPEQMTVAPHASAFSLVAARLGWPLDEAELLTVHGRPLETLALHLAPGARLLVLSADGDTPAAAAALLAGAGYGPSRIAVFERMGGGAERRLDGRAEAWDHPRAADLNTLAIECLAAPGTAVLGRVPGLPDDAFAHDGQLTKREVRAVTLAALAPWPGASLWDVGAGCGSVAVEWLRSHPRTRAVAIERDQRRAGLIAVNAARLGVPRLAVVCDAAPACLAWIADGPPDAVFLGGNVSAPGMLERCWAALRPGGRLVANAVTIEAEARLLAWHREHGGDLARLAVARLKPVGSLTGWDAMAPVTQYRGIKTG